MKIFTKQFPNLSLLVDSLSHWCTSPVTMLLLAFWTANSPSAEAVTRTWSPQGTSRDWQNAANWSPTGVPGNLDQVVVDNPFRPVELQFGDSASINTLFLTGGGRVSTGSFLLVVDDVGRPGSLVIEGTGSKLTVDSGSVQGRDVDTDDLEVRAGGELELAGGIVQVDNFMEVQPSARVTGQGVMQLNAADPNNPPKVLTLDGTVRALGGELRIDAADDANVEFGSGTNLASLEANFGDITIDATLVDRFQGAISVGAGRSASWRRRFDNTEASVINLFGGTDLQPATFHAEESIISGRVNVSQSGVLSGTNALSSDSRVDLSDPEDHLLLRGSTGLLGDAFGTGGPGVTFTGQGTIENEAGSIANLFSPPRIEVDFINSGSLGAKTFAGFATLEVGSGDFQNFTQTTTGLLNFDIGQLDNSVVSDEYEIQGVAQLDGNLEVELVELLNQDLPDLESGDAFEILSAVGGVTGQFRTVTLPPAPNGTSWRLRYDTNAVTLQLVDGNPLPGDFDFDGDADGGDFLTWQRNPSVGNLGQWETNFGSATSPLGVLSVSKTAAVPEPTTLGLMLLVAGLPFCLRTTH